MYHICLGSAGNAASMTPAYVVAAVAAVIAIGALFAGHKNLDNLLSKHRSLRIICYCFAMSLGIAASVFVDIVSFDMIAKGEARHQDAFYGIFLSLSGVGFVFINIVIFYHNDRGDSRGQEYRNTISELQDRLDRKDRESGFIYNVAESLGWAIEQRSQRLEKCQCNRDTDKSISTVDLLSAIDPLNQRKILVRALHSAIAHRFRDNHDPAVSIRVALYETANSAELGKHMSVAASYDGTRDNCITSPLEQHKHKFSFEHADGSCFVLLCRSSDSPIIYEDAIAASNDENKPFRLFDADQERHIKCLAGFRMKTNGEYDVITIDSNRPMLFREHRDENILIFIKKLVDTRFRYERQLIAIQEHALKIS